MRPMIAACHLLLLFAITLGTPLFASEPESLNRIGSQIEQYPVVRAQFTLTKQMAALKRPLVTTGRLVCMRQLGVLWQIEQPYQISYLLSDERIVEISTDGARKERGLREVPGLAQVGRVFRALLSANTSTLHEYFEVAAHGNPGKWNLELKPRRSQIAQFLVKLQITGGRFVETIRIVEVGGDTTVIRFHNSRGESEASKSDLLLLSGKSG
jgi:hypothetical protein